MFSEVLSKGDKLFIDSESERVCRFCGKSESQVTFKSVAHAIPESLGNKRVILLNECDECNSFFSETLEDSFDKYTKPYRLLFGVKDKKKSQAIKQEINPQELMLIKVRIKSKLKVKKKKSLKIQLKPN